jgi:C1A family cysteine protease
MKTLIASLIFCLGYALQSFAQTASQDYNVKGWKTNPHHAKGLRQIATHRDYKLAPLPASADLSLAMPPVYDQGDIGSCTANAGAGAFDYQWNVQHKAFAFPSRLGLYQDELKHDGNFPQDAGSYTVTILWVLTNQGVATERCWPYVTSRLASPAPKCAVTQRPQYMAVKTYDVPNNDGGYAVKQCIANIGIPVLTGGYVFNSIQTPKKDAKTKQWYVPMPSGKPIGGHEVLIVGYDDNLVIGSIKGWVRIRNSWGTGWGDKGYAWFPQAYILNAKWFEDNGAIELVK